MTVKRTVFLSPTTVDPPVPGAMPRWARVLLCRANALTPVPGLTEDDLMAIWARCEGRCAVSGLGFSLEVVGNGKARRPFAPSLDRIDRLRGYEPDNVRLVCAITNFAMNAWGEEPLIALARALSEKTRCDEHAAGAARAWYARQDARIAAAEAELPRLERRALSRARRRLAGLKRARTLGPAGLRAAALKAAAERQGLVRPGPATEDGAAARRERGPGGQLSIFG